MSNVQRITLTNAEVGLNAGVVGASGVTGNWFNTQMASDLTLLCTYTRHASSDVTNLIFILDGAANDAAAIVYTELGSDGGAMSSTALTQKLRANQYDVPVTATVSFMFNVPAAPSFSRLKVTRTGSTDLDTISVQVVKNSLGA